MNIYYRILTKREGLVDRCSRLNNFLNTRGDKTNNINAFQDLILILKNKKIINNGDIASILENYCDDNEFITNVESEDSLDCL